MTRAAILLAAALGAAAPIAGCFSGGSERVGGQRPAETRVLTMLDPFSNGTELTEFTAEVERLSRGALRIRIVRGTHKGPEYEAATIRDMQHGRADLAFAGSRAWDQFGVHGLRALNAPLLIDSYPLQERVLESDLAEPMLEELQPLGLAGIGILPAAIRRPLGLRHRLAAPSDFSGLTIGTQQSRVADATMRALGAYPRRFPSSIQSVDGLGGIEHRVSSIDAEGLDVEGAHLMTNVDLWPRPIVVFAAGQSYGRLTDDERRILSTAAANAVPKKLAADRSVETESAGNICREGRTTFASATPAELRALRLAVEPVYRELERDPTTRATIAAIERLKRQLAEPPAALPDCEAAAETPASGSPTEIDGVWRMDTDRRAADAEEQAENWGRWIYVFDRGRFAITQENQQACTWGYGTFALDGSRMSWTFTDGGGIAPNAAQNKPGEYFVFDISAYRDTLKLTPVEGEISPLNFRAKPWRRLSDTPSRQHFSKRCPPPATALPG
jgi:TRAP-type C4-dicarboxylate transport system substrate-binding protein